MGKVTILFLLISNLLHNEGRSALLFSVSGISWINNESQ